jgi:hypothetical protein
MNAKHENKGLGMLQRLDFNFVTGIPDSVKNRRFHTFCRKDENYCGVFYNDQSIFMEQNGIRTVGRQTYSIFYT